MAFTQEERAELGEASQAGLSVEVGHVGIHREGSIGGKLEVSVALNTWGWRLWLRKLG